MDMIENLGIPIETKTITLETLSKGGLVILGTPKLTRNEVYELIGCLEHEIRHRDKMLNKLKTD